MHSCNTTDDVIASRPAWSGNGEICGMDDVTCATVGGYAHLRTQRCTLVCLPEGGDSALRMASSERKRERKRECARELPFMMRDADVVATSMYL